MDVKLRNNIIILFVSFAIFVLILFDYVSTHKIVKDRILMDTAVEITVYCTGRYKKKCTKAIGKAFSEIERVERLLSSYKKESDVSRINNADGEFVEVSDETARILRTAKLISQNTDEAFDITMGHLKDIWGFTNADPKIPDDKLIKELLTHIGTEKITITEKIDGVDVIYKVRLEDKKAKIDLGGIAKGYAIEKAAEVLKENGIMSGLIDAGGDIVVVGSKKGGPFKIGIKSPDGEGTIGVINAMFTTVVTSGDYERYFIKDGKRYHHILDPKTGYPAKKSRSVTVVARDAVIADALSTALFVMGSDGIELVDVLDGVEAIIVDYKNDIFKSKGTDDIMMLY